MNTELTKQLREKYPQILGDVGGDPMVTCMAWGIECGDGWYNVLDRGFARIMETNPPKEFKAVQIKEKFGSLRFYADGATDEVWKIISDMEEEADQTCESCGSTEDAKLRTQGWWATRCNRCEDLYQQRMNELKAKTLKDED